MASTSDVARGKFDPKDHATYERVKGPGRDGNGKYVCTYCDVPVNGTSRFVKGHLGGLPNQGCAACKQVPTRPVL